MKVIVQLENGQNIQYTNANVKTDIFGIEITNLETDKKYGYFLDTISFVKIFGESTQKDKMKRINDLIEMMGEN